MKTVDPKDLVSAVAVTMTKQEKLTRWAGLVRKAKQPLRLYHLLERYDAYQREQTAFTSHDGSAFSLALADKEFQARGLGRDGIGGVRVETLNNIMGFFELTQEELHEFCCDCGGYISNEQQANRIAKLAGTELAPPKSGLLSRMLGR